MILFMISVSLRYGYGLMILFMISVSLRYGYGLMNATAMVDYGLRWINVPPKHICAVLSDANNV
jgi:hypothetical protein